MVQPPDDAAPAVDGDVSHAHAHAHACTVPYSGRIPDIVSRADDQRRWRMLQVDWNQTSPPFSTIERRQVQRRISDQTAFRPNQQVQAPMLLQEDTQDPADMHVQTTEQPPANAATPVVIDQEIWFGCTAPYSGRLPNTGFVVYYFPDGHAEQCQASAYMLPESERIVCTVGDVVLNINAETHEPYAIFTLLPGVHPLQTRPLPAGPVPAAGERDCRTATPASSSPTPAPSASFPRLDDLDTGQNIVVTDLLGARWGFRHIRNAADDRHMLTDGWSAFVNARRLYDGDTEVFMRRPSGELLVGVRRKRFGGMPIGIQADRVAADAAKAASYGWELTAGHGGCSEVDASLRRAPPLTPGTKVRLMMNPEDTWRGSEPVLGNVLALDPQRAWRMIESSDEAATTSATGAATATTYAPSLGLQLQTAASKSQQLPDGMKRKFYEIEMQYIVGKQAGVEDYLDLIVIFNQMSALQVETKELIENNAPLREIEENTNTMRNLVRKMRSLRAAVKRSMAGKHR
uniref:TF-B3 domain-containing protein n=1 Tax=Leersia perrieri TaxID=77586 RepID=A0A0D9WW93_9ORYZ